MTRRSGRADGRLASAGVAPAEEDVVLTIDCEECVMEGTGACDDCVVSYIVGREPGEAVVIDAEEERAVRLLAGAGLVPTLRLVRRTG